MLPSLALAQTFGVGGGRGGRGCPGLLGLYSSFKSPSRPSGFPLIAPIPPRSGAGVRMIIMWQARALSYPGPDSKHAPDDCTTLPSPGRSP